MIAWLKRWALILILADVTLGLVIFGVQGYQIHVLNDQQTQINNNAAKNDCWSHVLDQAISRAPLSTSSRAQITVEARRCVQIP